MPGKRRAKRNQLLNRGAGNLRAKHNGQFGFSFQRSLQRRKLLADAGAKLPFAGCQPANGGGFLSIRNVNELRRLAVQLDFPGIDQEKFRAKVPDARANLPANQRILIRWIVADDEYGLRFVKLLHRQRSFAGLFAKRGHEAGVIRRAVMINVIAAKSSARQALQQIIFFVRGAIGADKADRFAAIRGMQLIQLRGSGLRGLFPRNGQQLVALAQQRLLDALRMLREIKAEAPLHAQEILVDAGKVAIIGAQDFVIAHAQRGFAAIRAMRADRGNILHFPRPRLVTIRAAGQRAHRANINAHAALFAFQVVFAIRNDDRVGAAHADAERLHVHAFIANAHAAIAKDAARGIVINQVRPLFFRPVNLFFREAAGVRAVTENHVLQFAFAALVANRAIQRVVAQQKFQHHLARVAHRLRIRAHHHALGHHLRAAGLQLGHLFHFDQAHAASGLQRQIRGSSRTTELQCPGAA